MITLIDNYDSFTYNFYHYLSSREKVVIIKNDQVSKNFNTIIKSKGIVISPGPSTPFNSGECLSLVHKIYSFMPILGVCLGHQILGVYFGARIKTLKNPMHGKVSEIITQNKFKLCENLNASFLATRYQSLYLDSKNFPKNLLISARSNDDNIIMMSFLFSPCSFLNAIHFPPGKNYRSTDFQSKFQTKDELCQHSSTKI